MRDLQRRLVAAGYDVAGDDQGVYGAATEAAVRDFQGRRGLRSDGICGRQTWATIVEAGYRLGDRLLYHRDPPLRGDDVADLQRGLNALGFDVGRVDGIFGKRTAVALDDFQRNAGLTVDGVCGPSTQESLRRLGDKCRQPGTAAGLREREALRRAPRTLDGRRVLIGETGGLGSLASTIAQELGRAGATVVVEHHADGSEQAERANAMAADVALQLTFSHVPTTCGTAFFGRDGSESVGGRALAEALQAALCGCLGAADGGSRPMSLPVLRETRMPAVVCELGPPDAVVEHAGDLAEAFAEVFASWAASSWE